MQMNGVLRTKSHILSFMSPGDLKIVYELNEADMGNAN